MDAPKKTANIFKKKYCVPLNFKSFSYFQNEFFYRFEFNNKNSNSKEFLDN